MAKPKAKAGFAGAPGSANRHVNYEWDKDDPRCVCCGDAMYLYEGCEWSDDPALNLCHQCALGALEDARKALHKILDYPVHSEPVGGAMAMQDIAHAALYSPND